MSKHTIRKDKTCLNCNYVVENKFCSNCGQENSDTRKSFHHLFIHFFEDLTHYENSFWKTIKNLLFRPASLTKEYLSGKRMSYLAPIRLYIFISFVTFFMISVLPDGNSEKNDANQKEKIKSNTKNIGILKVSFDDEEINNKIKKIESPQGKKIEKLLEDGLLTKKEADTLISYSEKSFEKQNDSFIMGSTRFKSIQELDSLQKFGKNKLSPMKYWLSKKLFKVTHNFNREQLKEKFLESFQHNLPKALFIYMPIFAFLLWLFHGKKKYYYFDHGIFTLHFFSFLLTIVLLYNLLVTFVDAFNFKNFSDVFSAILIFIVIIWIIFYFFRAHRRFYNETRLISRLKSIGLFILNFFFISIVLSFIVLYSLINIH